MDASIIICTRNRPEHLRRALTALRSLAVDPPTSWEVVVVDNGSTDDMASVQAEFAGPAGPRGRWLSEPRPGKSRALNCGVAAAGGDILAFTDDDCLVDQHWLQRVLAEFRNDPALAVLGGRVALHDARDRPDTLVLGTARQVFSSPRSLYPNPPIIGANLAVRRSALARVGSFDPLLGPGTGAVAEDIDFIYRAYKAGLKVVYSPDVLVYHNHGRQTEGEKLSQERKYDVGRGSFYMKHALRRDWAIIRMCLGDCKWSLNRICVGRDARRHFNFLRALARGAVSRLRRRVPA